MPYAPTILLLLLGSVGYANADCYPGDQTYTGIVQDIYHGVTSDNIVLTGTDQPQGSINRQKLCDILTSHHNTGTIQHMTQTNRQFIGVHIPSYICANALYYTNGYNSNTGWQQWAGYHNGYWYSVYHGKTSDGALWNAPFSKQDSKHVYAVQPVRFDSQWRKDNCKTHYSGVTCRYGWNQSGTGVQYVWGWDPKDDLCMHGQRGTVVGFTFSYNGANCIVWVTKEEAFLECVKKNSQQPNSRRTSTTSGSGPSEGYGQWTVQ